MVLSPFTSTCGKPLSLCLSAILLGFPKSWPHFKSPTDVLSSYTLYYLPRLPQPAASCHPLNCHGNLPVPYLLPYIIIIFFHVSCSLFLRHIFIGLSRKSFPLAGCVDLGSCCVSLLGPQTGWFKQRKFIFSHFWRLEVEDQGVSMVSSEASLLGLKMATFSLGPGTVSSLCTYVSVS